MKLQQCIPRIDFAMKGPPVRLMFGDVLLTKSIMNKYFYFAVIRFEEVMKAGATRPNRVPVTHFGRNCYSSAEEAIEANKEWMCRHLGERFTVVGFEKKLVLDKHGISQGYVDDSPKVCLALFRNPLDIVDESELLCYSDEELCNMCIGVRKYNSESDALMAFAETPAWKSEVTTENGAQALVDAYKAELIALVKNVRNNPMPF